MAAQILLQLLQNLGGYGLRKYWLVELSYAIGVFMDSDADVSRPRFPLGPEGSLIGPEGPLIGPEGSLIGPEGSLIGSIG
jgi:hypothetical protein